MVFSMTKGSFLVSCLSSEPEMSFWKPSNIESKCILSCPLSLSLLPCNIVVLICGVRAEKYSYFVSIFFTVKSVCISRRRRLLSKLWSVRLSRGKTNKQTTCKRRVRLPQIFTSSRSKAALDDLLGDSHHEDPRHPLYEDVPHPGRHPVSARLPAREKCQREDGD